MMLYFYRLLQKYFRIQVYYLHSIIIKYSFRLLLKAVLIFKVNYHEYKFVINFNMILFKIILKNS